LWVLLLVYALLIQRRMGAWRGTPRTSSDERCPLDARPEMFTITPHTDDAYFACVNDGELEQEIVDVS
jgi:hypothetical protein